MFLNSEYHTVVNTCMSVITGTLDIFSARDSVKSYNMADLMSMQNKLDENIESDLIPSGVRIHHLVDCSFKAVGISKVC